MPTRRLQGAILLVGAAVFYALLSDAGAAIGFHWTPLVIGAVYLVAAAVGGRNGSYWSTAVVLTVFGIAPVAYYEYGADFSAASLYVVALGAAVLLAAQMGERGFAVSPTAVGATILALGVVYAEQTKLDVVMEPALYAGLLAAVGLVRIATGSQRGRRR